MNIARRPNPVEEWGEGGRLGQLRELRRGSKHTAFSFLRGVAFRMPLNVFAIYKDCCHCSSFVSHVPSKVIFTSYLI